MKPKELKIAQHTKPPNNACTGRLVGPAKKANPGEWLFPFRRLALTAAGNANR
jgi:hypothetical protein